MHACSRDQLAPALRQLADQGIYFGTSSWKYPGWRGQVYTDDRYIFRGAFSASRFDRLCLREYAEVFPTVCVDAAYYKFPDEHYLASLMSQVNDRFRFAFKVTDQITIKHFPRLPRFGSRAGAPNPDFLNADLFAASFLAPCRNYREKVGLLIFEFSRFASADFARGRDFLEALDTFLGRLPPGWPYGVEIRNANFLRPEYFALLARHGVGHVFNSWEGMPPVEEQMGLPDSQTHPEVVGARFLLRPGRKYAEAVRRFQPYAEIRETYPEGREAGAALAAKVMARGKKAFIYVNNRFEGNAPNTIAAMVERLAARPPTGGGRSSLAT